MAIFSSARAMLALDAAATHPGLTIVNGPPGLGHRETVRAWLTRTGRADAIHTVETPVDAPTILNGTHPMVVLDVASGRPVDLADLAAVATAQQTPCLVVLSDPELPPTPADASVIPVATFVMTAEEATQELVALGVDRDTASKHATYCAGWPGLLQQTLSDTHASHHISGPIAEASTQHFVARHLLPWTPRSWRTALRYLALAGCASTAELAQISDGGLTSQALMSMEMATPKRSPDDEYGVALIAPLRAVIVDQLQDEELVREETLALVSDTRYELGAADCGLRAAYELLDWDRCAAILDRWWLRSVRAGYRELSARVLQDLPGAYLRQFPIVALRAEYLGILPIGSTPLPIPREPAEIDAALREGAVTNLMERTLLAMTTRTNAGRSQDAARIARDMAAVVRLGTRMPRNGARELSSFWHVHAGLACQMAGDDDAAMQFFTQGWSDREFDATGSAAQDIAAKLALLSAVRGELRDARLWLARQAELPPVTDWTTSYVERAVRLTQCVLDWDALDPAAARPGILLEDVYANDSVWPYAFWMATVGALIGGSPEDTFAIADGAETAHFMSAHSDGIQPRALNVGRATAHLALGQATRAQVALGEGNDDHRQSSPIYVCLLLVTDRYEEAADYALRAVRRATSSPRSRRYLRVLAAAALTALGRIDEAAPPLSQALAEAEREGDRRLTTLIPERFRDLLVTAFPEHESQLTAGPSIMSGKVTWVELSDRESVVLQELARGRVLREIADTHFVSKNTVKTQVRSIYLKLNVNSRDEAVRAAEQLGLLDKH
ncbi:MAG: LuxR C-terminal-related transcriptional regulator [Marmoricola sp.]